MAEGIILPYDEAMRRTDVRLHDAKLALRLKVTKVSVIVTIGRSGTQIRHSVPESLLPPIAAY